MRWTTFEPIAPLASALLFRSRAVAPLLHPATVVLQKSTLPASRMPPASRDDTGISFALKGAAAHRVRFFIQSQTRRHAMQWITPSYAEVRFGFEITMYIANR
ncbi:pyrroloquinoline quinone precursor peptide PqqA [Paraburkholderia sp. BR14320]|uniref:pyrroloquinoline quinone precursor peptide PqqA n=1 Tax=unclassified Paraburkholderia TaxID=2615204 RepID=UPI0034D00A6F